MGKERRYSAMRGTEHIFTGTVEELAEALEVKLPTMKQYVQPKYQEKQRKLMEEAQDHPKRKWLLITEVFEDEDDDDDELDEEWDEEMDEKYLLRDPDYWKMHHKFSLILEFQCHISEKEYWEIHHKAAMKLESN